MPSADSPAPRVLAGYELLERVAASRESGTITFRAKQLSLGRVVRVTLLPPSAADRPGFRARFERQLEVASRLRHDNVVSVIDAGTARGCRYVVFEEIEGQTLADTLARDGPLPPLRVVVVGLDVARALHHLSEQGFVHRRVSPSVVLLPEFGPAKLGGLDFAKTRAARGQETWYEHDAAGAHHTAPEHLRSGHAIDIRADLYSLGCTLFEAATGRAPFTGGTAPSILARHATEVPPDPRTLRDGLPEGLVRVIDGLLRKDPEERPARPEAVVRDLEAVRDGRSVERRPGTPLWRDRAIALPAAIRVPPLLRSTAKRRPRT